MERLPQNAALMIVDVQLGFDDPEWGVRNNPEAEARIADLLHVWRRTGRPIVHIQHESRHPEGHFRPGTPGHALKPAVRPLPGEPLFRKTVNSAFIGTPVESHLRQQGITHLVVVGLTTNHCVSTTVRMAGNLGFDTTVVEDATATFARAGLDGRLRSAEDVHAAALSDLHGEFAQVASTADVVAAAGQSREEASAPTLARH